MSDNKDNVLTAEEKQQMEEVIKSGQKIIFPERADQWEEYVKSRFQEEYRGKDAVEALTIIEALGKGKSIEDAKKMLEEIKPNGAANGLIRRAILLFSDRGPEFWKGTAEGHISIRTRWNLFKINRENNKLKKLYENALPAGEEHVRDEEVKSSVGDRSQSWILSEDEIQIVNEQQNEIIQKAKDQRLQLQQQSENQEQDEYNKGLER
ncbi:MAG: hypothetical protein IJH12_09360 [Clostridia bacterium]|nr:hypothetical protein [Clostridia bacterium]